MEKLIVGIPVKSSYSVLGGGAYSYSQQLLLEIDQRTWDDRIEPVFLNFEGSTNTFGFKKRTISFHPFAKASFSDKLRKGLLLASKFLGMKSLDHYLERHHARRRAILLTEELKRLEIDVLYYVDPEITLLNYPFIVTHWDIGHRSTYSFPELGSSEQYQQRSAYYRTVMPRALKIFVESESGKEELIRFENIFPAKIRVIPMFPGPVVNEQASQEEQQALLARLGLAGQRFLFYPAQFWPHKNHLALLSAMERLKKTIPGLKLVLSGSDKGNLSYIRQLVTFKHLQNDVIIAGFVDQKELYTLYRNAAMMVMPTFLGPSNIPPLEAAFLNCPVLISDLPGHREMLGDYADYFDPENVDELTAKLESRLLHPDERARVFEGAPVFNLKNASDEIEKALIGLITIRKNWDNGNY